MVFSGPQADEIVTFPRTGLQLGIGLANQPGGRTDWRGIYNNLWGLRVTPNPNVQVAAAPAPAGPGYPYRYPLTIDEGGLYWPPRQTSGGRMMSLFTGQGAGTWGGGGTDWGSVIGGLGQGVLSIFAMKQQNKQLKRLSRLQAGAFMPSLPSMFAPSAGGVPAAAGAGGWGALPGILGAAGAGILGLGPDLLPGGLEEGGTGLFGQDLFKPTNAGQRQRMIDAVNPATGERVYWRPVGRPIMFTGDRHLLIRTRKTVRKMSGAAGCGVAGGRFRRRRR